MKEKYITMEEKLYQIRVNDKVGCIDKTGKVIVEPKFEEVEAFSEGLAFVEIEGKRGFIDKTGNMVIEPRFEFQVV
jgi:hypothetical protein